MLRALGHYALLTLVTAALCLPNLGVPSLWDIDEGHNAEAAREMLASGNWVVPTFNFQLRVDKPALLYWLQMATYKLLGVNELAARLPSAAAALVAVLATYELGRRMFGAGAGLLAGVALASAVMFCAAGHFANPDALLCACTTLTFCCFWHGVTHGGHGCYTPVGLGTGFAVLAKGPVGLVLPLAVTGLYLLWGRRLRVFWDRRMALAVLAFVVVAVPWYAAVGAETKADFLRGFWLTHNVGRFLSPMENHRGPFYYYLVALLLGFAPWSAFAGLVGWNTLRESRATESATCPAVRFLLCWVGVYVIFFSFAGTKLPNYILPAYPAVALLTGRFLDRWRRGEIAVSGWALHAGIGCLALVGVGIAAGLLVVGGVIEWPGARVRVLPGLAKWALLGMIPLTGAVAAWWCLLRQARAGVVAVFATTAVLFVGSLAAWGAAAVDGHKAPRPLVEIAQVRQTDREVVVGCYEYYQPSLVFYCGREVCRLSDMDDARAFLTSPFEAYLFLPATVWESLSRQTGSARVLARHYDFYRGLEVFVVTNR